jgi:hypothetical protein
MFRQNYQKDKSFKTYYFLRFGKFDFAGVSFRIIQLLNIQIPAN